MATRVKQAAALPGWVPEPAVLMFWLSALLTK